LHCVFFFLSYPHHDQANTWGVVRLGRKSEKQTTFLEGRGGYLLIHATKIIIFGKCG